MSGELFLAISCGAMLVVAGLLAYLRVRRDYSRSKTDVDS